MQVHPVLPLGGRGLANHPPGQTLLQGPLPSLHERGIRTAGGIQPDQAGGGQQDQGSLPGRL